MSLVCSQGQIDACIRHQTEVVSRLSSLENTVTRIATQMQERKDQDTKDSARRLVDFEELKEMVVELGSKIDSTSDEVEKGKLLAKLGSFMIFTLGSALGWGINLYYGIKH